MSAATSLRIDSYSPQPCAGLSSPSICLNPNPGNGNSILLHPPVGNGFNGGNGLLLGDLDPANLSDMDLHKVLNLMAEKQKADDQVNEILRDWKTLAQKVDYFLFWVFLGITSGTSLLFIFILPYYHRGKLL